MVSPTKILSQKRKLRPVSYNLNSRNKKRLEVYKTQFLATKGNKSEMAKKNIEIARRRDMNKLSKEVNKMTLPDARRILKRIIRQYKT